MKKITQKLTKSIWKSSFVALTFLFGLSINAQDLSLQGVLDLTVPGGGSNGKGIHLVATADIANLSVYGTAYASNGNESGGVPTFIFPAVSLSAGDNIMFARSPEVYATYFDMEESTFFTS
jgi:hypothetical protein